MRIELWRFSSHVPKNVSVPATALPQSTTTGCAYGICQNAS